MAYLFEGRAGRVSGCALLALALAGCAEGPPDNGGDVFTEPAREAGDLRCELTGTYETEAECERFAEQYASLDAGIDAFKASETMIADEPTIVRYSVVRLAGNVQGEDGEIAAPVAPPPPPPPPPSPPAPSPEPTPEPVPSPPVGVPSPVPTPGQRPGNVIIGQRPIVIARPGSPIGDRSSEQIAAEIVIPDSWQETALSVGTEDAIAEPTPAPAPAPPPPPPPAPEPTGPTQAEIDQALAEARDRANRNIGAPTTGGTTETGQVKMGTIMYACLDADPSFKVEPADCQPKNTREDPDPVWRWTVTPSKPGEDYQLTLRSGIVVEASDGGLRKIGQPSRTARIDVEVTALGAVKRFFASAEEWLRSPIGALGALAALLIAFGGVRQAWKKMKSDEQPAAAETPAPTPAPVPAPAEPPGEDGSG